MNATNAPAQNLTQPRRQRLESQGGCAGKLRSVELPGPAGRLEAILNMGAADARYAAVLCPPHPLHGGTMHNKVVYHAMKAMNDVAWGLGWPVLRFNFRGVGLSQGTHDGMAEAGDVLAALDWLEQEYGLPMVAAGFSFGAAMTQWACCGPLLDGRNVRSNVRAVAALGLPTALDGPAYRYPFLRNAKLSKLFVSGDRDQFAPAEQLAEVYGYAAEPKRLELIAGADHFFTNRLEAMQQGLAGWLKEQLP
jgi:alpha/beta superfamily hydrolase